MKVTNIESLSLNKFKNKEEFCNRLLQEVTSICKNFPSIIKSNEKEIELKNYKDKLLSKNESLDILLKKSEEMKNDLNSKIEILKVDNDTYRDKLLELLGGEK